MCESSTKAATHLGRDAALSLINRLSDLRAADNPTVLPKDFFYLDSADLLITARLSGASVLVCSPNHVKMPTNESGCIDWHRVKRIKILGFRDDGN